MPPEAITWGPQLPRAHSLLQRSPEAAPFFPKKSSGLSLSLCQGGRLPATASVESLAFACPRMVDLYFHKSEKTTSRSS